MLTDPAVATTANGRLPLRAILGDPLAEWLDVQAMARVDGDRAQRFAAEPQYLHRFCDRGMSLGRRVSNQRLAAKTLLAKRLAAAVLVTRDGEP